MDIPKKIIGLTTAARVLLKVGRKESAIALLTDHPKDAYTTETLALLNQMKRNPGVSVIMATHKGAGRILRALESLAEQTLNRKYFEVVVVHNGPEDGTDSVVQDFAHKNPNLSVNFIQSEPAGAGIARNAGCAAARFDHMTFLDDDDYLSAAFLQELYELADGTSIIFSQIADFDDDGQKDSLVNIQLLTAFKDHVRLKPADAPSAGTALTMTCIKLFPSYIPEIVNYDPNLKNGEDVVFWTEALMRFNPDMVLCPPEKKAIYYRENRAESISRQPISFQFNILDRVEVAKCLSDIYTIYPAEFVKQKAMAAAYFMAIYLKERPQDYSRVRDTIDNSGINFDLMQYINKSLSKTLAISFCFPPWVDTAGVVAAKRMLMTCQPFDIISNNMSPFRENDPGLKKITHDMIGDHVELNISTKSTIDTQSIVNFSRRALSYAVNLNKYRKYENLYSRVMWPASHFAAAAVKVALPNIRWTAEFSDPMVVDILAKQRPGAIDMDWVVEAGIPDAIKRQGYPALESDSLMEWCEYVAYALAEEVIFTNINQREYMLSQPWIVGLRDRIEAKSVISPHPVLPLSYYEQIKDDWKPSTDHINIAYFGNFYKTRGLGEVLDALSTLDASIRDLIRIDIYTAANSELHEYIFKLGLENNVKILPPLPFFTFLSRCRLYNFLLVNDAATIGIKSLNPYLPSKVSDYLGAGKAIWALVEEGSPLSKIKLPAGSMVSELGNVQSYRFALEAIVRRESVAQIRPQYTGIDPLPPSQRF
jgi:glycosyltransferase involved in cell wall biosynthesis